MTPEEFGVILHKIKPFTNYIYLHVLGEPLLHPHLDEILKLAQNAEIHVNITTNGGLLKRKQEILLTNPPRQINISLHDAEENIAESEWESYINSVLTFATNAAANTYINMRLWNGGVETSQAFNTFCLNKIADFFNKPTDELIKNDKDTGLKLADHIFLQTAPRFDWPDGETQRNESHKTCYALRDQIAILVDGTIVPCCLDADGAMNLGNIFTDDLSEILKAERAQNIRNGFINNTITEDFCKSCGFFI
jgi:radical SAM protein with 4Fe4S-binding SPASM domain